ncbi:glycoside hydrolase family 3 protein [Arthrobacter sp. B0490]|uniref:beta-glucosidase n=1 Tax=Arthrobacter sp. B0490 TaxID=2058891 RepID=UPI001CA4F4E4|nr:glycoside hydrolase family 3 C-terminal domain-containing protein [Arthrobacter sp. B0490]
MDTSKSPDERARILLDASSLGQKYRWLVEQPANDPTATTFSGVQYEAQLPCTPKVVYTDGPDGVRFTSGVTAFPAPIALGATWNRDLVFDKSAAQSEEAFDKGKNVVLGPGIASGRTPLSGRTAEYFGEDSLLSGRLAASAIRGIEEGNPGKPVLSNLKHYVANEQEISRNASSSNVDERTLREAYDLPFEIAIAEGDPESIMCSYNQINGIYACENPLLNDTLRSKLGFDGYIMSDFGAVHSTAPSLTAGLDQELNRPIYYTPALLNQALAKGEITEEHVDNAAFNVVRSYIRGGLFDTPLPTPAAGSVSTAEHKDLARRAVEEGTVLLKNDGVLPLSSKPKTIAVIGPTASKTPTNGVSALTACSMKWPFGSPHTLDCSSVVTIEEAVRERAALEGSTVVFDDGSNPQRAATVAAAADVTVVVGYYTSGEFNDLPDLRVDGNGDALISAVAAASPATVAILQTGSAVEMPWLDATEAVLESWYAGEQQGPALVNLLWGDVNPSGKLPMTFPASLTDTPTRTPAQYPGIYSNGSTTAPAGTREIRQVDYSEGLAIGHKWYDSQGIDPLFAFGHGLSYTDFEYRNLRIKPSTGKKTGTTSLDVKFQIKNTGKTAGAEAGQVYLTLPDAAGEPGKRLIGFEKVTLKPGQTTQVHLVIDAASPDHPFSTWDSASDAWTTPRGTFTVEVGGSSRELPLISEVALR